MWIFVRDGFYSVVQHNQDSGLVQVRARTEQDLTRLSSSLTELSEAFSDEFSRFDCEIIEMRAADYRWRMNVPRAMFARYMGAEVYSLNYTTNVKGELAGDDKPRKKAMMRVWEAMYELQRLSDDTDEELSLF